MSTLARTGIRDLRVRGSYPNLRSLLRSADVRYTRDERASEARVGYSPPVVEYESDEARGKGSVQLAVRDIDLPFLCQDDREKAAAHLALILEARRGDRSADEALQAEMKRHFGDLRAKYRSAELVEDRFVVLSTCSATHPETFVSHKGSILLKLSQLGYPVPDFVILTSETIHSRGDKLEPLVRRAVSSLETLTGQQFGGAQDPLIFAVRCAMPCYYPGVMPTFLNVGVTERNLDALGRLYGAHAARKMFLNNLKNLYAILDQEGAAKVIPSIRPDLPPAEVTRLLELVSGEVRRLEPGLLEDPLRQALLFIDEGYREYEDNQDLLLTLSRGAKHFPAFILQKMVCTVRDDEAYAGVLFSRHSRTGVGMQLETAKNIFGEEIMTGTVATRQTCFEDREAVRGSFPAIYHFHPHVMELEQEFQSAVTIEFASEATKSHELFALLQLNTSSLTGRAAFISVTDMHKSGFISRKRVTELICPYHIKQIESDAIDPNCWKSLERFSGGVAVLPRTAVSARIYFSAETALKAKKRGEKVCFCKKTFAPNDTMVMREMDAVISLTSAAIHVVTICQSFGAPALLSLEKDGVRLEDDRLINAQDAVIKEGDWVTVSSQRQGLFKGKAQYRPARLMRYMKGEPVELADDERKAFDDMAYAYRYYNQLVRGMKLEQVATLKEVIRLVNLDLRGEAEEARELVRGWFDAHETAYVDEVFKSDMGDHLNQHTVFDMLTLDRKTRFFKAALERCFREKVYGYNAGAFMLGRFVSQPHPVAFWKAFTPVETGLLVHEWLLFEKYMQVLYDVGERQVLQARKKILKDGLDELRLTAWGVKPLIALKLGGFDLGAIARSLPEWCDLQANMVLELLGQPYGAFYDFSAAWSVEELEKLCRQEGLPVPKATDR